MKKSTPESPCESLIASLEYLRKRAENNLKNATKANQGVEKNLLFSTAADPKAYSIEDVEGIVHELQVHQIELEMQNEELRQVQIELQQAHSQYFELYENAPAGYLTLTGKGVIVELNLTAANMLGMTKASLLHKPLSAFIVQADQDIFYFHCQQLLKGKAHDSCELRLILPDERQIDICLESSMVKGQTQFRTLISNISQRKLVENELKHSQLRLQAIVNTATEAIITIDSQGVVQLFNKAAETMFGYAAKEITGHNVNILMPAPYHEQHDGYITNYLKTRQARVIGIRREVQGQRKDGRLFPLSFRVGEFQEQGQPYFTGILEDITERKLAEQAIRESEERLSLIMDAIGAGFWDWDILNDQVIHNSEWYQRLGLDNNSQQYTPKFFKTLIHPDDLERVLSKLKQVLKGKNQFHSEHRLRHSDGHYIWVQENGIVVKRDKEGEPLRMVGSFIDISPRKHKEKQQREHQHDYERLLKLEIVNQTIAAIAHQLNQPLNAVASYTAAAQRFLQKEDISKEKLNYALNQSTQQVQRAGQVMHELFNVLQADEIITEAIDLNKLISRVIRTLKDDEFLSGYTATLDLHANLPLVAANALQLEKVLINLIRNGIEAMTGSGLNEGMITISISTVANNSCAQVSIRDCGPGVSFDIIQHIFEPFYSTKPDGLGMGLAVSRALIEFQGGQLWCQPNDGNEGATFYLTIPFAQESLL